MVPSLLVSRHEAVGHPSRALWHPMLLIVRCRWLKCCVFTLAVLVFFPVVLVVWYHNTS